MQNFADGSHREFAIMMLRFFLGFELRIEENFRSYDTQYVQNIRGHGNVATRRDVTKYSLPERRNSLPSLSVLGPILSTYNTSLFCANKQFGICPIKSIHVEKFGIHKIDKEFSRTSKNVNKNSFCANLFLSKINAILLDRKSEGTTLEFGRTTAHLYQCDFSPNSVFLVGNYPCIKTKHTKAYF